MLILLIVVFCSKTINSELTFNMTENQISQQLLNIYSVFNVSKNDRTMNLNEIDLINGHFTSGGGTNLEINRRTGDVMVKIGFDREEICPSRMTDDCPMNYILSYKSVLKEFKVTVKDTNDNAPIFKEKMKEIYIREGENDKSEYLLPSATDLDTAVFGIDKYVSKFYDDDKSANSFYEYFKLTNSVNSDNIVTPVLKIIKLLDRERVERFSFTLVALDKNQKSGDCKIFINVIDVNDNSPVWSSDRYSAEIKECSQTKEVLKLEANDQDDRNTDNGRITYEIGEKTKTNNKISSLFHVSGNMLCVDLVKLQDIDIYEFDIEVLAKDGGGRSSAKTIDIKILDCNKNKPQIDIGQRNPKIQENVKQAVKLTNIIVQDPDRGLNGEFDCGIDDTYRFSLTVKINRRQKAGKWMLYHLDTVEGVEFDREKVSFITVVVTCNDKGVPSQVNSQAVTVHITDVNDNGPLFTKPNYIFSVEENVQIGVVVGVVVAIDGDSSENGRVSYEIESSMKDIFSVNNKGQIQTNGELDREKTSVYEFKVLAKDNGVNVTRNSSCNVKVFILDVNDCSPEVNKQFMFEIVESRGTSPIHVNLGKIEAKDSDLGLNGTLNYRIGLTNSKEPGRNLLQITSDGFLSIYGVVDREVIKTIHFEITISDNGKPSLSTVTTVIVNILDVNDNKPKFIFPNYSNNNFVNISLQSSIGSVLAMIEATDPDSGSNGTVSYKLMGAEHLKSFFELHQSGQLILIKSLAEKRLTTDRMLIQASDGGEPPLSEIATLYLRYFNNKKVATAKNAVEKKTDSYVKNDKDLTREPGNVTLLYGLAAVLFVIFVAGLIALFFIYARNRTHLHRDFSPDKAMSRKNYSQTFQTPSNEYKGNEELMHPTLCETADGNVTSNANYTHLMFIKDPNYNLLYPRMLSKSDVDAHNEGSKTLNYFHYQSKPDLSLDSQPMRMLVNNLSPPINRAQTLTHQTNPLLMYKDSEESLDDSNYNFPCSTNKANPRISKEDPGPIPPASTSGYTQSYITSTFV